MAERTRDCADEREGPVNEANVHLPRRGRKGNALNARLAAIQIDQAVLAESTESGLRASAIPDITARARNTLRSQKSDPGLAARLKAAA